MDSPNTEYTMKLTVAQWDLIVLSLGHVFDRATTNNVSQPRPIDTFACRMLRRRLNEVMTEIQSVVPDAGSGNVE